MTPAAGFREPFVNETAQQQDARWTTINRARIGRRRRERSKSLQNRTTPVSLRCRRDRKLRRGGGVMQQQAKERETERWVWGFMGFRAFQFWGLGFWVKCVSTGKEKRNKIGYLWVWVFINRQGKEMDPTLVS